MEHRSSTSSSSCLDSGALKPGPAFWVALLVVVVVRFLLAPLRDVPDYDNADFSRFVAVKRHEIDKRTSAPLIVFAGSSRTQYGIDRTALGMDPAAIACVSVPSGNPWSTLEMVRSLSPEVLFVDLSPIQFNASRAPERNRFAHMASLSQRLALDPRPDKPALVIDVWSGHLGIRRSLKSYGLAIVNARRDTIWGSDDRERLEPIWLREHDHERLRDTLFAENVKWKPENFADETFRDWRFSEFLYDCALRIKETGAARIVFHQPPFHPRHLEDLQRRPEYAGYLERVRALADERVTVLIFEDPRELGIQADEILDYGHFGRTAARTYTRELARILGLP